MTSSASTGSTATDAGSSSRGSRGAGSTGGSSGLRQSLCAFWLGSRCFGLDVALVGEVVVIDAVTPVPKAHEALVGLFNLRGTPVPLVDAAAVLSLEARSDDKRACAIVVRKDDLVVALAIEKMEAVIESGRGAFTAQSGGDEHPVVQGFLESGERVVTVIAPDALLQRLDRLRFGARSER
ncbi:MAG TPA: chemotaxis protein CheW [Polyangiaceae bacterium]